MTYWLFYLRKIQNPRFSLEPQYIRVLSQIEALVSVIILFFQVPTGFNVLKTTGIWYPKDVIIQAVYLKLRFSLSYRDIEEILKDRGLGVDHATVQKWVIK